MRATPIFKNGEYLGVLETPNSSLLGEYLQQIDNEIPLSSIESIEDLEVLINQEYKKDQQTTNCLCKVVENIFEFIDWTWIYFFSGVDNMSNEGLYSEFVSEHQEQEENPRTHKKWFSSCFKKETKTTKVFSDYIWNRV